MPLGHGFALSGIFYLCSFDDSTQVGFLGVDPATEALEQFLAKDTGGVMPRPVTTPVRAQITQGPAHEASPSIASAGRTADPVTPHEPAIPVDTVSPSKAIIHPELTSPHVVATQEEDLPTPTVLESTPEPMVIELDSQPETLPGEPVSHKEPETLPGEPVFHKDSIEPTQVLSPGTAPAVPASSQGISNEQHATASPSNGDVFDLIPALNDTNAPKPHVGQHDISPEAVKQRAKRIFTPRADGSLKVSQQIFDEWKGKGPRRRNLEMIFKQCGYDPEPSLSFKNFFGGGSCIEGSPDPYYQLHQ